MDIQKDRELLTNAKAKGPLATLTTYVRLSGPGWLQSAITLGGGSLASSLYLARCPPASVLSPPSINTSIPSSAGAGSSPQ
jgi:hypothetical protein